MTTRERVYSALLALMLLGYGLYSVGYQRGVHAGRVQVVEEQVNSLSNVTARESP